MNIKALSDITKIVVETDEKDPKTIAVITADDIDSAEGFRVRITPKYEIEEGEIEMDKELNKVLSKLEGIHSRRLNQKLEIPEDIKKELEEISSRIIAIFEEKSMSYASAYNMLDIVHAVLEEKSTRVKL